MEPVSIDDYDFPPTRLMANLLDGIFDQYFSRLISQMADAAGKNALMAAANECDFEQHQFFPDEMLDVVRPFDEVLTDTIDKVKNAYLRRELLNNQINQLPDHYNDYDHSFNFMLNSNSDEPYGSSLYFVASLRYILERDGYSIGDWFFELLLKVVDEKGMTPYPRC